MKPSEKEGDGMAMTEQRYGYCDEIAAIVDMSKLTIEGGEEMTTDDVVERLNQLEEEIDALEENRIDLCVMLKEWVAFIHKERLEELRRETSEMLERNMGGKETP